MTKKQKLLLYLCARAILYLSCDEDFDYVLAYEDKKDLRDILKQLQDELKEFRPSLKIY